MQPLKGLKWIGRNDEAIKQKQHSDEIIRWAFHWEESDEIGKCQLSPIWLARWYLLDPLSAQWAKRKFLSSSFDFGLNSDPRFVSQPITDYQKGLIIRTWPRRVSGPNSLRTSFSFLVLYLGCGIGIVNNYTSQVHVRCIWPSWAAAMLSLCFSYLKYHTLKKDKSLTLHLGPTINKVNTSDILEGISDEILELVSICSYNLFIPFLVIGLPLPCTTFTTYLHKYIFLFFCTSWKTNRTHCNILPFVCCFLI